MKGANLFLAICKFESCMVNNVANGLRCTKFQNICGELQVETWVHVDSEENVDLTH